MIEYSIPFNVQASNAISPFFDVEHLWLADPHGAVSHSASIDAACDARMSSRAVNVLTIQRYLEILFSALPRSVELGSIVGFSREFFRTLRKNENATGLVGITNYIFKVLALGFQSHTPLLTDRVLRLSRELHYWANVELHSLQNRTPDYYRVPKALDEALRHLDAMRLDGSVVFTFLTANYLENFGLWLDLYLRHDVMGEQLIVLAIGEHFGDELTNWLLQRGATRSQVIAFVPPVHIEACGNGKNLDFMWYVKIHVTAELLNRGQRVVYSDMDAYWVNNYFIVRDDACAKHRPDVILSLTYDMPLAAVMHWGFTPCAGFFSVEPTDAGKAFLMEWRQMTEVMFDDQIALAEILLRQNASWEQVESKYIGVSTRVIAKRGINVDLAMLGPDTARRVGLPDLGTVGRATIWHPRWKVSPEQHKNAVEQLTGVGQKSLS
jgi:hypothetical protein